MIPNHYHSKLLPAFESTEKFISSCHNFARTLESTLITSHSGFNTVLHHYNTIKRSQSLGFSLLLGWIKTKKSPSVIFSVQEFDRFCLQKKKFNKSPLILFILLVVVSILASLERKPVKKPKKLDFARAVYSFQGQSTNNELSLEPNDLIAILSKGSNDWWHGRLKNGKTGYFPANHVKIIVKKTP